MDRGFVSNLVRVLGWHPQYLEQFLVAHAAVMLGDGPLPLPWRYYIAMMAAASHGCEYLFRRCQVDFVLCGGDVEWLLADVDTGCLPRKLAVLGPLNAYMAHQPWMVRKELVTELVRGEASWSVTELVHVMVILATYHSLASLVLGLGIVNEPDIASPVFPQLANDSEGVATGSGTPVLGAGSSRPSSPTRAPVAGAPDGVAAGHSREGSTSDLTSIASNIEMTAVAVAGTGVVGTSASAATSSAVVSNVPPSVVTSTTTATAATATATAAAASTATVTTTATDVGKNGSGNVA